MHQREQRFTVWLVVSGLAIGLAYVYSGFVPHHEWLLAPAAVLCLAAALWYGLRRSKAVAAFYRLRSAAVWMAVIATVMALPAGLRWAWMQREVLIIPVPADASEIQRKTNPVVWTAEPPYSVRYVTPMSFEKADAFLARGFTANGWKVGRRSPTWYYGPNAMALADFARPFRRKPVSGWFRNYTIIRNGPERYVNVTLFDGGNERWIACEPQVENAPYKLRHFWR